MCGVYAGFTLGYLEFLGQPSMATIILWPSRVAACRVSMRILGMRRSAGVNKCLVDCEQSSRIINNLIQVNRGANYNLYKVTRQDLDVAADSNQLGHA